MLTVRETLTFETTNQSVYRPGTAYGLSFSTDDLLVFGLPSAEKDFGGDIGVASLTGTVFVDIKMGLRAYADLGTEANFDANYEFDIDVTYDTAIDLSQGDFGTFGLSDAELRYAKLSTTPSRGAKAGLDFVIEGAAGVKNGRWEIDYLFDTASGTFSFDIYDSFVIKEEIFKLDYSKPFVSFDLINRKIETDPNKVPDSGLRLLLPIGEAATATAGTLSTNGLLGIDSTTLDATARTKKPFVSLEGDLDEFLLELLPLKKFPILGEVLGLLFDEDPTDIGKELDIPFVSEGDILVLGTLANADAKIEGYLEENFKLEFQDQNAPIAVSLRLDNGTTDLSDDTIVQTTSGSVASLDFSDTALSAGIGSNTITATYDLSPIDYSYGIDLAIEGSVNFQLLTGSLDGDLVPDALKFSFGPIVNESYEFLDENIDIYDNTFTLGDSVFDEITRTYDVFVVADAPDGLDLNSTNAVQEIYAYREAIQENATATFNAFGDLWNNDPAQTQVTFNANTTVNDPTSTNITYIWQGNVDAELQINRAQSANNHVIVNAPVPGNTEYGLRVDLILQPGGGLEYGGTGLGADTNVNTLRGLLNDLGAPGVDVHRIVYNHGNDSLQTNKPVNIVGTSLDDLLVMHGTGPRYFDGGAGTDIFIADFSDEFPNTAVTFTSSPGSSFNGAAGFDIFGSVTVKNIEGVILRTGNADDVVSNGIARSYLDTGGGDDLIRLDGGGGSNGDNVLAGAGDDVILIENFTDNHFDYRSDPLTLGTIDRVYGGTGFDRAIYDTSVQAGFISEEIFGARISVVYQKLYSFSPFVADQYGTDFLGYDSEISTSLGLFDMVDIHDGGDYGETTDPLTRDHFDGDTTLPALVTSEVRYNAPVGAASFAEDIEAISFIGSDHGSDLALFAGGLTYEGGEGVVYDPFNGPSSYANTDTLVGNFGAYTARFGLTEGIFLRAEDRLNEDGTASTAPESALAFGDATIRGFERLVVEGTEFNDTFLGGKFNDGFRGGYGNDRIDGGEFEAFTTARLTFNSDPFLRNYEVFTITENRDVLIGGLGDDIFSWSDDGADLIEGDQPADSDVATNARFAVAQFTQNDLLIVKSEADSQGLEYGLYDENRNFGGAAVSRTVFDTNSSHSQLLNALTLINALGPSQRGTINDPNGTGGIIDFGAGLRFGDTLGNYTDAFLDYRGIDHVNISTEDDEDDLLIYQDGATYIAGEATDGSDRDTFAADFTGTFTSVRLRVIEDDTDGQTLANGAFIQGMERLVIKGSETDDILGGGALDDYLHGGDGRDTLYGGDDHGSATGIGNDSILGGDGDDVVMWYADGTDLVDGGDGFDTLILASRVGELNWDAVGGGVYLFTGLTAVSSQAAFEAAFAALDQVERFNPYSFDGISDFDLLDFQNFESVNIAGTDAKNDVAILLGGTVLNGGDSVGDADVLFGDLSDALEDLTIVADATDNVGSGNTTDANGVAIAGTAVVQDIGNGTMIAGFERLHLTTGSGDDVLTGGEYTDVLDGGDGDDTIDGGGGGTVAERDIARGGIGNDVLIYNGGHALVDGGFVPNDHDLLQFEIDTSGLTTGFEFSVLDNTGAVVGDIYRAGDIVTNGVVDRAALSPLMTLGADFAGARFSGRDALQLTFDGGSLVYRDVEQTSITGSDFGDFMIGTLRESELFGAGGDDVLISGTGRDKLVGGAGVDTYGFAAIFGGFGADLIAGEDYHGGILYFEDVAQTDVTFSVVFGDDLKLTTGFGSVVIQDYFEGGGNGFDFTFDFTDTTGKIDLTGLAFTAEGSGAVGSSFIGTDEADNFRDQFTVNSDSYEGGRGDDFFTGSGGDDFFNGSTGQDTVSYLANAQSAVSINLIAGQGTNGIAAGDILLGIENVFGSDYNDNLRGSSADNVLAGFDGNDTILGLRGNDMLTGGRGNDTLDGGTDDDLLTGGQGNDILLGGEGDDTLLGSQGNDTLNGGAGNDDLAGGAGDDTVDGGEGSDTYLYGGADDATTTPTGGLTINVGDENGHDVFDGGDDFDDDDIDTVDLSNYEFAVALDANNIFTTHTFDGSDFINARLIDVTNVERFIGTRYDDYFVIDGTQAQYFGAAGDDTFVMTDALIDDFLDFDPLVFGGAGYDTLTYGGPANTFGVDIDFLLGRYVTDNNIITINGFEAATGTNSFDAFNGGDGDDTFSDLDDDDFFNGRGGNDTLIAGVNAGFIGNDTYRGGEGFDTLDYTAAQNGIEIDLFGDFSTVSDRAGQGAASVGTDSIREFEIILTGSGNDLVIVDAQDDIARTYVLGEGNDSFAGQSGNDRVFGGLGNDTLAGGGENDEGGFDLLDYSQIVEGITITLNPGQGIASGAGVGTDSFTGFERVTTGQGDDTIFGNTNDDYILYAGERGAGGFDYYDAGAGTDTADFSNFGAAIRVDLEAGTQVGTRDADDMHVTSGTFRNIMYFIGVEQIVMTDFSDEFLGSSMNDYLDGGLGDDFLTGRDGGDVLVGGSGSDTADYSSETGGAGVLVDLSGQAFTIVGGRDTYGNIDSYQSIENARGSGLDDTLIGNLEDNVLDGGDGNDMIFGTGGNNILSGGAGTDEIAGGIGDDLILGGDDNDTIDGGAGNDNLIGGEGGDALIGGSGMDQAQYLDSAAGLKADLQFAQFNTGIAAGDTYAGIENLGGSSGDDSLRGDGNDNQIEGLAGDDFIIGRAGDDILYGDDGDDVLMGGEGADTLVGGLGIDRVQYNDSAIGVKVDLQFAQFNTGIAAGDIFDGVENLRGSNEGDSLRGDGTGNRIEGLAGADILLGRGGNDTLIAGDGDDVLYGGRGGDTLNGGDGMDRVQYTDAAEGLKADLQAAGVNTGIAAGDSYSSIENIYGSNFGDDLRGDESGNIVSGQNGSDFMYGRDGDDTLLGGFGDDRMFGGAGADTLNGGSGNDRVIYTDSAAGLRADLGNSAVNTGIAAGDIYINIESLYGSNFADDLRGDNADSTLLGRAGADTIFGRDGDDKMFSGADNDVMYGGAGADLHNGGGGRDRAGYSDSATGLRADLQNSAVNTGIAAGDTYVSVEDIYGSQQDDDLRGDAGGNIVAGLAGDDTLYGRDGNDILLGGSGDDLMIGGDGADNMQGGGGVDTVAYNDSATGLRVDLLAASVNTGIAAGDTYSTIENLRGSNFDDDLRGDGGNNRIDGRSGDDTLTGRDGNDALFGGIGDDLLRGGNGFDTLDGGVGADSFRFDGPMEGADDIINFTVGVDTIQLNNAGFTALSNGALAADNFRIGAAAADGNDYVVYDNGDLYYDADGNGAGAQVLIATLTNGASINQDDIFVI